jgi:hypothetical protein
VAVLTALLVTSGIAAPAATAQDLPLADGVAPAKIAASALQGKLSPRLNAAGGKITAFVELAKKPAVDAFNAEQGKGSGTEKAKQAAKAAKADTAGAVDSVIGQLKAADSSARLVAQTFNAAAGAVVTADAAKTRELAKRPDFVSVRTVVPKTRSNSSAPQLTNTLSAWQQTGRTGDGIRIGVIDDGIDYTHADFGGPGTPAPYNTVDRAKPTQLFPTAKVVGGTDLVGDDYDSAGTHGSTIPKPDANPLACGEHGTHVARLGGFGVNADGSTFTGDYSKLNASQLNALKIGPGTAPKGSPLRDQGIRLRRFHQRHFAGARLVARPQRRRRLHRSPRRGEPLARQRLRRSGRSRLAVRAQARRQ